MSEQVAIEIVEAPAVSVEVVEEGGVQVVEIIHPGPQGPAGTGGAEFYVHTQAAPSSIWTMTHNLGFKPSVELLNAGSQEIEGDVVHLSQNVCIAYFTIPIAGFARLN